MADGRRLRSRDGEVEIGVGVHAVLQQGKPSASRGVLVLSTGFNAVARQGERRHAAAKDGSSWRIVGEELGPVASICVAPDGSAILAGLPNGLARSSDGGQTWEPSNHGLHISLAARLHVSPAFSSEFFRSLRPLGIRSRLVRWFR